MNEGSESFVNLGRESDMNEGQVYSKEPFIKKGDILKDMNKISQILQDESTFIGNPRFCNDQLDISGIHAEGQDQNNTYTPLKAQNLASSN